MDDGADKVLIATSHEADVSLGFTTTNLGFSSSNGFGGNVHAADLDLDGDVDVVVSDVDVDIPPCNSSRRMAIYENVNGTFQDPYGTDAFDWVTNSYDVALLDINNDGLVDIFSGKCQGYEVIMSNNCALAASSADYDLDGIPDACDECPTNPSPDCQADNGFPETNTGHSMARQWNELLLSSIRGDFARPTVHARNLWHSSMLMWDAWAVMDSAGCPAFLGQDLGGFVASYDGFTPAGDVAAARDEAIAFGMYRLLRHRFASAPQATSLLQGYDEHMATLGYDVSFTSTDYSSGDGRALGNHLAAQIIAFGDQDGSNEQNDYANTVYEPLNPSLIVDLPGNPSVVDMNRWQPLTLDLFIDQSGNPIPGETPPFLSPEWGQVTSWALNDEDLTSYTRDGFEYKVYHDPGQPALFAEDGSGTSDIYVDGHAMVALWSGFLDPTDGVMWDISPAASGNRDSYPNTLETYASLYDAANGGSPSPGHSVNPATGAPYAPNLVPRGDYARILAEFWADGPDSETPPGHWFTILNYVSDHPELIKQFQGEGPVLDDLEWDVKSYLALGSAMHDCAISAWGPKGGTTRLDPSPPSVAWLSSGKAPTQAHRTTTQVVCLWCLAGLKRLALETRSPGHKGPTLGRSKFGLGKEARPSTTSTPNLPAWVGSWPNRGSPTSVPRSSARRSQDTSADTAPFHVPQPRCSPPSPATHTSPEEWGRSLPRRTNFWCSKMAPAWTSNCSGPRTVTPLTNAACHASMAASTPISTTCPVA